MSIEHILEKIKPKTQEHYFGEYRMGLINFPIYHTKIVSSLYESEFEYPIVFLWHNSGSSFDNIDCTNAIISPDTLDENINIYNHWSTENATYDIEPVSDAGCQCVSFKMKFVQFTDFVTGRIGELEDSGQKSYRTGLDNLY